MPRPIVLLVAVAALGSAPLAASAQTWSASTTSGAQKMVASRAVSPTQPKASSLRAADLRRAAGARVLNLKTSIDIASHPEVDLRPRAEWYDDQGFQLTGKRVGYKRRF